MLDLLLYKSLPAWNLELGPTYTFEFLNRFLTA